MIVSMTTHKIFTRISSHPSDSLKCLIIYVMYFHTTNTTVQCVVLYALSQIIYKNIFIKTGQPSHDITKIARFMGPTWGPPGDDRTQVGPMLAPRTLLLGSVFPYAPHMTNIEEEIHISLVIKRTPLLCIEPYFMDSFYSTTSCWTINTSICRWLTCRMLDVRKAGNGTYMDSLNDMIYTYRHRWFLLG